MYPGTQSVDMKHYTTITLYFIITLVSCTPSAADNTPPPLVAKIQADDIGAYKADIRIEYINPEVRKVSVSYRLNEKVSQPDCAVQITPSFKPDFHWAPHLTPTDNHVIDQHVFRTPAMFVQDKENTLIVVPAPENPYMEKGYHIYMDMDARNNKMALGLSRTKASEHVLYERTGEAAFPEGIVKLNFYIISSIGNKHMQHNPFRYILSSFWHHKATPVFRQADVSTELFDKYCAHTYRWAFDSWKESVWQEFELNGKKVGAPVFIVNVTQSPGYPGEINEREMRSVWNQAWFSSLRSASGLYRYARRKNDKELLRKALLSKELALSAPQKDGLFYSVIATEMEETERDGKKYNRSKGWNTAYWGNSNRNPVSWDIRKSPFHILDMSWTAYIMLQWYDELEKDRRLPGYATRYAEKLLALQDGKGYFPAWIDTETLHPLPYLADSPESSMSALFLLKLYRLTNREEYKSAALRCLDVIRKEIIPAGRWEDFETYWSCSRYGASELVGRKVERNNMYKQCNFSMFWTASALLEAYRITNGKEYLATGQRVVDELLMTQASWQPPYIYVDAIGGFGVMNADGEWNDSRGSLFAEMLLDYGEELDNPEYTQRGIMALKTSFSMMYCPENPGTKKLWEKTWSFFSEKDYGFMMENYGHGGATSPEGEGMGEFTIYDWGNGAAAEAYNRILDHWGESVFAADEGISAAKKVIRKPEQPLP